LKRHDRANEIADCDAGVALLNQLLCGRNLLRIYIRHHRLVDGDLRQLKRASKRRQSLASRADLI
jgi:hypothetical protein